MFGPLAVLMAPAFIRHLARAHCGKVPKGNLRRGVQLPDGLPHPPIPDRASRLEEAVSRSIAASTLRAASAEEVTDPTAIVHHSLIRQQTNLDFPPLNI